MSYDMDKIQKELIENLEKVPIVQLACEKVGISRAAYYRWIKDGEISHVEIDNAKDRGRTTVNEMCESQLIAKIREGETWPIKYWLENNDKRYARNKTPLPMVLRGPRTIAELMERLDREDGAINNKKNDDVEPINIDSSVL